MRSLATCALLCLCFLSSVGCGYKYDYGKVVANAFVGGNRTLAVDVIDERKRVVSGEKKPNFSGVMRANLGKPTDITTASGSPLTADFAGVLTRSLEAKGFKVASQVWSVQGTGQARVVAGTGVDLVVRLRVLQWAGETLDDTDLTFDLVLEVENPATKKSARCEVLGRENLGTDTFDPIGHGMHAVPLELRLKLEQLFSDGGIQHMLVG